MDNIFCIDLEDWYHQSLISPDNSDFSPRVERNAYRLLELFSKTKSKVTFFTLGQIAEKHPALIRDIQKEGHEIACHGHAHAIITGQTPEEFRADVMKGKALLEDVCGTKIKGYRAPSWTITRKTLWALDILQELGFIYDSSIFPVQNFLYGIPDAPLFAHQREANGNTIWEIPPSVFSVFGKNLGFSGGFYFRVMPESVIRSLARGINKKEQPAVFYLHPVEIDKNCPRIKTSLRDSLILYWGIQGCEKKLYNILRSFSFVSIEKYYNF